MVVTALVTSELAEVSRTASRAPVPLELADGIDRPGSMAERLAAKLSPAPTGALVRSINAALVLMADHELATSTLAVRLAASTHADLSEALSAGLGTIAGPLHGGASQLAYGLLLDAERRRIFPGYGWLFPGADGAANVGIGVGLGHQRQRAPTGCVPHPVTANLDTEWLFP